MKRFSRILEIQAPVDYVYEAWKQVEDFPHVVSGLRDVTRGLHGVSTWTARFFGKRFHWRAAISEDVPNTRIRWTSLDGNIEHSGLVEFIPADGCCVALVVVEYQPPLGLLGRLGAFLFDAEGHIAAELDRVRTYIERGAVPTPRRRPYPLARRRDDREDVLAPAN